MFLKRKNATRASPIKFLNDLIRLPQATFHLVNYFLQRGTVSGKNGFLFAEMECEDRPNCARCRECPSSNVWRYRANRKLSDRRAQEQGHEVTLFASGDLITSGNLVSCATTALRLDPSVKDIIPYYLLMLDRVRQRADEFDILHFHIDHFHFPAFQRPGRKRRLQLCMVVRTSRIIGRYILGSTTFPCLHLLKTSGDRSAC